MKKTFIFCALLITLCANTIIANAQEQKHSAEFDISALYKVDVMTQLRRASQAMETFHGYPFVDGSVQYREVKASLGIGLPCGVNTPFKVEAGFYLSTPTEKDWQVYGGFTVGARNRACDEIKTSYTPSQGVFAGTEVYIPDYISIQEWAGDVGLRVGYSHDIIGRWAAHVFLGWSYSIGLTERRNVLPEWAQDETSDMIMKDMKETIPVQHVNDTTVSIGFGLKYHF